MEKVCEIKGIPVYKDELMDDDNKILIGRKGSRQAEPNFIIAHPKITEQLNAWVKQKDRKLTLEEILEDIKNG